SDTPTVTWSRVRRTRRGTIEVASSVSAMAIARADSISGGVSSVTGRYCRSPPRRRTSARKGGPAGPPIHAEQRRRRSAHRPHDVHRRAGVVALGTRHVVPATELAGVDDHEAARAGELALLLGDHAIGGLGIAPIRGLLFLFVLEVVPG